MKRLLILAAALVAGTSAYADVAFNNFGSGDSFDLFSGKIIAGPTSAFGLDSDGYSFTSATTGDVTSITVAGTHFFGDNSSNFSVYADNAGTLGTLLGSASGIATPGATGTFSFAPSSTVSLTSGLKYWLVESTDGSGAQEWNATLGANMDSVQITGSGTAYNPGAHAGAFRIETSAVPEPMTLLAVPAVVAFIRRRRKSA